MRLRQRSQAAAKVLGAFVGADELMLLVAFGLIAAGFWHLWRPGAFLVPGFAILWIALPSRLPLVSRPIVHERRKDGSS